MRYASRAARWAAVIACLAAFAAPGHGRARLQGAGGGNQGTILNKTSLANEIIRQPAIHDIGKIALMTTNFGQFGRGESEFQCDGEECPSCQYPVNSDIEYLYTGALWIGAVVGQDTLVSVGSDGWFREIYELLPASDASGGIIQRSTLPSKPDYHPDAVSEQDYTCTFTDTITDPVFTAGADGTNIHRPIRISVLQSSYAWSYDYAEDFVILDYRVANIGIYPIRDLYIGLYIDADVYHKSIESSGYDDDICGFRRTVAMPEGFGIGEDSVNIAWIADADGDPVDGQWNFASPVAVTGTRVLQTPNKDLRYSFNWWVSNGDATLDFGPRLAGTPDDPFRSFGTHLGTPTGDANKYYIMSHPEFDYDQLFTAVSHTGERFLPPPPPDLAQTIANGYDTRYLLSFGPFDIRPGDSLPVTIAYVAGDDFHRKEGANDFADYFEMYQPDRFYGQLDFTDLGKNARWAYWVFDNPGYDTDGDKDSGRYNWACSSGDSILYFPEGKEPPADLINSCRKVYYAGDGVPDFRAAAPPPPPVIQVIPDFGEVTIRWNGQLTENAMDIFSGEKDFEGYRVYFAQGPRATDYVLLAAYDRDNYKIYVFDEVRLAWQQNPTPLTRDSLRILYGPEFEPLEYDGEFRSFRDPETQKAMYFVPQGWNQSRLDDPYLIHRVCPEASRLDPTDTTKEGWMRYYEYEYHIANLQPTVPYYFSVTAMDYGSLKVDLGSLESSPLVNAVMGYALPSSESVEAEGLEVIVYPNPYRIDGGYARAGYENRDRTRSAERSRAINFVNLPKICTIRIFTVDGDLVQEIDHSYPEGGPSSQHETWNVVSRNTQAVVTGIYIWHVKSDMGEQLGKLVIIK